MSAGVAPPPRAVAALLIAVLLTLAAGGCGSVTGSGQPVSGRTVPGRTVPGRTVPGPAVSGRAVFAAHCQVCHSLSGSSSPTQQGGDLRGLRLPRDELVQFTVEMPVITRPLTAGEVRAVVSYMRSLQRRH